MKRRNLQVQVTVALTMAAIGFAAPTSVQAQQFTSAKAGSASPAVTAMETASSQGKYLFVYFWKQNDQPTQSMQGIFQEATGRMADEADAISVQITDPSNAAIVKQFGVSRAPMPLALAIAPNGAVTAGLPVSFSEQQLREAIVSHGTAACLKAMQDRKTVLLCVKHRTGPNAFQGAQELTLDKRFAASTQIVEVDPADSAERKFLQSLEIDSTSENGVMVVLTPPGQRVATFAEHATKAQIVERLTELSSACCPGGQCGPDGTCAPGQECCPGGNCPPAKK
ncbi:hypothetical protein [Allorhodopirellula solitaria]|uniref:Thioredoxin domain-containing protein n=1 Tax=Allorhodopirellula solitaria TaxID=2527987 RepID=A0A5C5YG66_9BACT|nr:hypothetical protein [Allorhodopirellula solitaria]TWT74350.1 hypothetical protein CA85_12380 [Allorhodopirellula solitaria]